MRNINLFLALLATLLFAACSESRYDEANYVSDEGLLLNDDLVAVRFNDGKLSIRNKITGEVTIKDINLDWTTPSPYDSLAIYCSDNKRGYYNAYTGEITVPAQYRHPRQPHGAPLQEHLRRLEDYVHRQVGGQRRQGHTRGCAHVPHLTG